LTTHRPYDPMQGRWLTTDPIQMLGGSNFYEFVLGNPINLIDSSGLAPSCTATSRLVSSISSPLARWLYKDDLEYRFEKAQGDPPNSG
jgi:uncharacterized protein RhaS with RHS repeats